MHITRALLSPMAWVFVVFGLTGFAMSALPLHVHHTLGRSTFIVGLVSRSQFAAALASRLWAGHLCDRLGPIRAIRAGLLAACAAGFFYVLSTQVNSSPNVAVSLLLIGRGLMGGAESFVMTGALAWGLATVAPNASGQVMAWIGTAMYGAFALGAPVGLQLYTWHGLRDIGLATMVLPLLALTLLPRGASMPAAPALDRARSNLDTWRAVWMPGLGLALSSIGFAAVTVFIALLYVDRGWPQSWAGFSAFASAFVCVRVLGARAPDRFGGPQVALVSLTPEATGLALIAIAQTPVLATLGAGLAGAGYSLVYPSFGIQVVRNAPAGNRALALGSYTACLDLALCMAGPLLGILVARAGLQAAFSASAIAVLSATLLAAVLARQAKPHAASPAQESDPC